MTTREPYRLIYAPVVKQHLWKNAKIPLIVRENGNDKCIGQQAWQNTAAKFFNEKHYSHRCIGNGKSAGGSHISPQK